MKRMKMIVGNDNGNSEHDIVIDGEIIKQPNVFSEISILPNIEELNPDYIAKNIHDNLIVTVETKTVNNGMPTTYYIGNYVLKTGKNARNIEVGAINSKLESDIPVVNTLAHIAGQAIYKFYKKEELSDEEINIDVDMTTALPVAQYSKVAAKQFADRFIGEHKVIVYLGSTKVRTSLKFDYVKVLPEAVPTTFYLQTKNENIGNILAEFKKDYPDQEADFKNKRILHVAIGEGTTEFPMTEDVNFKPDFIRGENKGVGHAINDILPYFIKKKTLLNFKRQDFSQILKDQHHKYHDDAIAMLQAPLKEQALDILSILKEEVYKANNDLDYIIVYGGGSILMKNYIKQPLKDFGDKTDIKVIYVEKPYAVELEAWGMYEFCKSNIYKTLKEKYLSNK